ncbi:hypothetical protein BGZ74_004634, partial [Mortierella antarctica]
QPLTRCSPVQVKEPQDDIERAAHVNIQAALADYRAQRYEHTEFQVKLGKKMAKIMFGQ